MRQRDISTIDLDKGETSMIHTKVHVGGVLIATVEVTIMVLEADDGHLKLMVDQNTVTNEVPMIIPTARKL